MTNTNVLSIIIEKWPDMIFKGPWELPKVEKERSLN